MEKICQGCNSTLFDENGACLYCGKKLDSIKFVDSDISHELALAREAIEHDYDFQRSLEISHGILEKYPKSQEANWVALLSENQIIYIQNGQNAYVPTFLDAEGCSILTSKYYKALDKERRDKADKIEMCRKDAVAEIAKVKSTPYDIFISYKQHVGESGNGEQTDEAELAQQLYNKLIQDKRTRDLHIFFDKESLGRNNAGWEPHIYSAIKTAKFMIVVASSIENMNSRWVKNEWMRFLLYRTRGEKKDIVILGTQKENVNPVLFPKMIADTGSQAIYEREDWREIICVRALQACSRPLDQQQAQPVNRPVKNFNNTNVSTAYLISGNYSQPTSNGAQDLFNRGEDAYSRKEYNKATGFYLSAANQGHAGAQYILGQCYFRGTGVKSDYNEAVKWLTQAANRGHLKAQYDLGVYYHWEIGDYVKAAEWYNKAAEQGHADAKEHFLGIVAFLDYKEKAIAGDAQAQYNLAQCLMSGREIRKNEKEAVKWYKKAARQGNSDAQRSLGAKAYLISNYRKAVYWYKKAARQGNSDAQCLLGDCYMLGNGVLKSYAKAEKWYKKAAEQGHSRAARELLHVSRMCSI